MLAKRFLKMYKIRRHIVLEYKKTYFTNRHIILKYNSNKKMTIF